MIIEKRNKNKDCWISFFFQSLPIYSIPRWNSRLSMQSQCPKISQYLEVYFLLHIKMLLAGSFSPEIFNNISCLVLIFKYCFLRFSDRTVDYTQEVEASNVEGGNASLRRDHLVTCFKHSHSLQSLSILFTASFPLWKWPHRPIQSQQALTRVSPLAHSKQPWGKTASEEEKSTQRESHNAQVKVRNNSVNAKKLAEDIFSRKRHFKLLGDLIYIWVPQKMLWDTAVPTTDLKKLSF